MNTDEQYRNEKIMCPAIIHSKYPDIIMGCSTYEQGIATLNQKDFPSYRFIVAKGFMTSLGRFVDSHKAWVIAWKSNQIQGDYSNHNELKEIDLIN
jgi:hypothetical protein